MTEKYTEEMCVKDTKEHIKEVDKRMNQVIFDLHFRAKNHDNSKLQSPELETFTEYTPKLANVTYGSDEYKEALKGMKVALDHHYAHNSHHPEHYPNGIKGMDILDLVEMLCDWKAASMRHNDGNLLKSIEHNQKRFNMSEDLVAIFKNSAKLFE